MDLYYLFDPPSTHGTRLPLFVQLLGAGVAGDLVNGLAVDDARGLGPGQAEVAQLIGGLVVGVRAVSTDILVQDKVVLLLDVPSQYPVHLQGFQFGLKFDILLLYPAHDLAEGHVLGVNKLLVIQDA